MDSEKPKKSFEEMIKDAIKRIDACEIDGSPKIIFNTTMEEAWKLAEHPENPWVKNIFTHK